MINTVSKKIIMILVWLFSFLWFSFAYQQQWFDNYNELNWSLSFNCSAQCFILIWPVAQNDFVNINWNLQWNGVLWYWFLVWEQIYPWETLQINWWWDVDQKFILSNSQVYWQIPWEAQLVFLFQWNFVWNQVSINWWIMDIFDKIWLWRNDFRKMEPMTPYSINLRYWIQMFWISIVKYWYIIFIIFALWLFLFSCYKKEKKYKKLLYLWICLFLFVWIRNFITYTDITYKWIKNYTFQKWDNKTFFDIANKNNYID